MSKTDFSTPAAAVFRPQNSADDVANTHAAPRPVTADATGKAILVGEHAVVHGAKAVAMPLLSMQMGVRLTPLGEYSPPRIRVMLGGRTVSDHLKGVIDEAFDALGIRPFSLEMEGTSSVLIGAGLGSSASLCIVVLKALAAATGKTLTPTELATLGNRLERRFHGNPSGLDTAVVALEHVIAFRKGEPPVPTPVARPEGRDKSWRFALLDSGARSSTIAMIQAAAPWFQAPEGAGRVRRFDALAEQLILGLKEGRPAPVAAAMNEAGELLREAGVVGPALESVIDAARAEGVLAVKSTGAGGGGCALALLDPERAEAQLAGLSARLGAARVHGVSLP